VREPSDAKPLMYYKLATDLSSLYRFLALCVLPAVYNDNVTIIAYNKKNEMLLPKEEVVCLLGISW